MVMTDSELKWLEAMCNDHISYMILEGVSNRDKLIGRTQKLKGRVVKEINKRGLK